MNEIKNENMENSLHGSKFINETNDKLSEIQTLKSKNKMFKTLIATSIASSIVGGTVVGGLGFYFLPKTNLYKNITLGESVGSSYQNSNSQAISKLSFTNDSTSLTIPQIAKKVGPAVVGISTMSTSYYGRDLSLYQGEVDGMGSGIVFNTEGYVVTNYHVVEGAQQINVIFSNGKEVKAKLVNYDQALDIAVVKITDSVEVPAVAEFGDSDKIEVGETAVAIGNPLGKDLLGSVTAGVISAVNRQIDVQNKKLNLIQTDAAINPGNSGGALVNSKGQVIGINTAKLGGDGVEGIGFAIPINTVKAKVEELSKPILKIGISGRAIDESLSKKYKLPIGVYVLEVQQFSAAERAGVEAGDVIIKIEGESIKDVNDINSIKAKYKAGDTIKVELVRDNKNLSVSLKLSE